MTAVDFVVNCYERTYRDVLEPGYVRAIVDSQRFDFAAVTVTINNVADRWDAERRAARLRLDPTISRVEWVADHLPEAMKVTGMRRRDMDRLPHFTDCGLVAVTLPGPDWVCYWDADARLREPHDWITPTLNRMASEPCAAVGNPNNWHPGLAEREALRCDGDFAVGYGFSDVAFLARRSDLARKIYHRVWRCPASRRYPLARVEPVFEQRIDAWMRTAGRLRVTYLPAVYEHVAPVGVNYPT